MRIDNIIKRLISAQEAGVTHVKLSENQIFEILPDGELKQIYPMTQSEKEKRNYEYSTKPNQQIDVKHAGSRFRSPYMRGEKGENELQEQIKQEFNRFL
jgi:hypothetical protein